MKNWITYHIGDFLAREFKNVVIDDFKRYKRLTIKTKGQGIGLRDEVEGVEIGTKNQFIVNQGQFLLSKIDAMNGAFGIVPKECDGAIITGNFWTYNIDDKVVHKEYLQLLCSQQVFTDFSLSASEGTTNRKYLKENKFLNLSISLPSLVEQQLIINNIERINSKIETIKLLRREQEKEIQQLVFSKYLEITKEVELLPMSKVAPICRRQVEIDPGQTYYEIGVRSFGKGLFEKPHFKGSDLTWQKPFWMQAGDLLFSNIKAWEGAVALIPSAYDGWVGSHRYITCLPDSNIINPEFLQYYFQTFEGVEKLSLASPGTADRNRTLNNKLLAKILIPVPSLVLQQEFVSLLNRSNEIGYIRKEQEKELSNLLSALLDKAFKGELSFNDAVQKQTGNYIPKGKIRPNIPIGVAQRSDDLELAMIIALMESRLGNTYGEVGIQKTVFNVAVLNPVLSRQYNFVNYHYGTYSSELKETLKVNPLLNKKTVRGNEVFTISNSHKSEVLNAISNEVNNDFVFAVNSVLDIYITPFIGKHTDKIELLNTVVKLIIDLHTIDSNAIYQQMRKWKIQQHGFKTKADKFSLSDTMKTIELLQSNELTDTLLSRNILH